MALTRLARISYSPLKTQKTESPKTESPKTISIESHIPGEPGECHSPLHYHLEPHTLDRPLHQSFFTSR